MGRKIGRLEENGYRSGQTFLDMEVLKLILAETHLEVLSLTEVQGKSLRQIGAELNTSENAAKMALRTARKRIIEALEVYEAADKRCRVLIIKAGATAYRSDNGQHRIVRAGLAALTTDRPQPFEVTARPNSNSIIELREWVYEVLIGSHSWIVRERYVYDPNPPESVA